MAKKNEITLFDDIIDGKDAMLQFIDIFRKAIKGDKFAAKLANRILDEWQEECDNLPDESEMDENFAFLPPSENVDDMVNDEFSPSYEKPTLKRPNVSLELAKKKRKSAEEKEELDWYGIDKYFDPEECDCEYCEAMAEDWNSEL